MFNQSVANIKPRHLESFKTFQTGWQIITNFTFDMPFVRPVSLLNNVLLLLVWWLKKPLRRKLQLIVEIIAIAKPSAFQFDKYKQPSTSGLKSSLSETVILIGSPIE